MKTTPKKIRDLIILLFFLPILVFALKFVYDTRKGASGKLATITIDPTAVQGEINSKLWQNLSQGGEESIDMIGPVSPLLQQISPKLIRIDHLYDYYQVDQGNGQYNFSGLDKMVKSILSTGAKPLLSISYTTASMAKNGQNAGEPKDWNQWYNLVKATARHYSIDQKIDGIYYEVWNEPDLFGSWKYNRDPNYSTLYIKTASAIKDGATGANYKVGGPATTAYYSNWIKSLFKTASQNNLRLDFISWHKYSKNIFDYEKEIEDLNKIISDYPQYYNIERLITEVGPNPEPDTWYDTKMSGIHLMALTTKLSGKIHRLFTFEPFDGPTKRSELSTGWGIISRDLKPKPRYYALQFLNQLSGNQVSTEGNGSWVSALASKKDQTIQVLLVNYDPADSHAETFPLTIQNLTPGKYQQKTISYLGKTTTKTIIATANYRDMIYLTPNSAILVELTPIN